MRIILTLPLALALAGCGSLKFPGAYQIFVEQGNVVDADMLAKLKPEMTRQQVRYVLGTPLVEDPFNPDRWDYIYVLRRGSTVFIERQLTVYFEDDVLSSYTSTIPQTLEVVPAEALAQPPEVPEDDETVEAEEETAEVEEETAEPVETAEAEEDTAEADETSE